MKMSNSLLARMPVPVRRFQRIVFGIAMTVTSDPTAAEDVAQQTFEQAWRHAQVYDSRRGTVRAWLTTIAHNLAVDVLRARARPRPWTRTISPLSSPR